MGRNMGSVLKIFRFEREYRTLSGSPAYRATLLLIRWAQVKTALTFLFITV